MAQSHRSRLAVGLLLIIIGAWFLAAQVFPGLQSWINQSFAWPMIIVGVGGALLVIGLLTGAPSMAIPATIVAGIGGLLYWQNATGNWESWAYTWTLIPGFVGVGTVIAGLFGDQPSRSVRGGLSLILTSLVLFLIFGAFLGGLTWLGPYWPVILIGVGVLFLILALARR